MISGSLSIENFNYTDIVLIQKGHVQLTPADYRPTSLCNSIYKIMSKVLCNRLVKALPTHISPNQCAFLKGKSASDNALIGLELIHQIYESKSHNIALKLDLSKAFDRVEWDLVTFVMRLMNFP